MLEPAVRDALRTTLGSWLPPGSEVAILDVPVHRNIGDMFILAATMRMLAELGCRIVHRAGVRDYHRAAAHERIRPETIVVGLGGGNFGDVYPRYQRLRERILHDFPENRIVILPQTIHFTVPDNRTRMVDRFSAHPDIRIAVRDRASLEIARAFTPHVALLPDVVHALDVAPEPSVRRAAGMIFFMRRDREKRRSGGDPARAVDWPAVFPGFLPRLALAATLMPITPASYSVALHDRWTRYADALLSRGLSWMAGVDHLVTDRLHAAILARLGGRPVTLLDNAYGKLRAYYDAWWRDDPAVQIEDDEARVRQP